MHQPDDVQMTLPSDVEGERRVDVGGDAGEFDWETHLASYTGRARIERLLFVAESAPALRRTCSTVALREITSSTKDVSLYHHALRIRNTSSEQGAPPLPAAECEAADATWCEQTEQANRAELEKLDLELRNYQHNMIKESIRMGYRDLGDHLRSVGSLNDALKYYIKTRDYCSTNEHLVEMCLNVIEVSLHLKEYGSVAGYVNKAEGLLDSYNPDAATASSGKAAGSSSGGIMANKGGTTSGADAIGALFRAGGSAGSSNLAANASFSYASGATGGQREAESKGKRQVQRIRAKLYIALGLASLGQSMYEHAARCFLKVDIDTEDAFSTMISRAELAALIVLCSVAMFDRTTLKALVVDRAGISALLGHDAQAQQLLDAFYACEYRRALALLERGKVRAGLTMNLAPHYEALCHRITQRALRQFVQPFDTLGIARLASSMGWTNGNGGAEEGALRARNEVLQLLQKGDIDGRLDAQNDILYVNKIDQRQALFDDALQAGKRQSAAAKRVMLRVSLLQNGLVAKLDQGRAEA